MAHYKLRSLVLLACIFSIQLLAQQPQKPSASEIYHNIQKLNFLGSAMYMAAHPDDENTRLISYLANDVKARTAYLSLTRGDGGQNLVGPEIRELLGVIRTQELLQARATDGGKQFTGQMTDPVVMIRVFLVAPKRFFVYHCLEQCRICKKGENLL